MNSSGEFDLNDVMDSLGAIYNVDITKPMADPSQFSWWKDYTDRVLWLGNIDVTTIDHEKIILQWNRDDAGIPVEERKPIKLFIFSPGGSVSVEQSFIDVLLSSRTPVIGVNMGMADSAAFDIYLACTYRYTLPHSEFLIHKGSASMGGTYGQLESGMENYRQQIDRLGDFVVSRTNIPKSLFDANYGKEWYLNADEAIKYGIAHKIITDVDSLYEKIPIEELKKKKKIKSTAKTQKKKKTEKPEKRFRFFR